MLQQASVNCVPASHMFSTEHSGAVTRTTVKPNAFRVNYFSDGTGRDTFVKTNNGGFYKGYKPAPAPPVTSFMSRRRYEPPAPVMKSRGVQYHSDGTGRDSYIGFNAGGLTVYGSKIVDNVTAFKSDLRKSNRPQSAYVKSGGFSGGIQRKSAVTLLPAREGDTSRRKDILTESQMTFNR